MGTTGIIVINVLVLGWAVITIPTRILFPYLVSKQLACKDLRLSEILAKIPIFRITKRANSIEKLIRKPQNKRFMVKQYPVTYKWYLFSIKWSKRVLYAYVAIVLLAQLSWMAKFVVDPKGEMEEMHNAAEQWKNRM